LGDIFAAGDEAPVRGGRYLPPPSSSPPVDAQLLAVLEKGRTKESGSDLTVSPLTAFVYRSPGHEGTAAARPQATRMFARKLSAREFLATLDAAMVRSVTKACAEVAVSRRDILLGLDVCS